MRELEAPLRRGLSELALTLDDSQVQQMLDYLALLAKWGRVYNLTGRLEPAEMLSHHLLDSLAIVKPLRRQCSGAPVRVLDVGAGAGLPGWCWLFAAPIGRWIVLMRWPKKQPLSSRWRPICACLNSGACTPGLRN